MQFKDNAGRIIVLLADIQGQETVLANIYVSNGDDQKGFIDLEKMPSATGNNNVVLGGEFNLVIHSGIAEGL